MITIYSYGLSPATRGSKPLVPDMIEHSMLPFSNPWSIRTLRDLDGEHQAVVNFVRQSVGFREMIEPIKLSVADGQTHGFLCMGGKHRSVVAANMLYAHCKTVGLPVKLVHRVLGITKE